ncbi:MAG: biopolymer transporter ExbD [Burkholderiaceae bacterium]|nr:biopolymer transporter ExbD [Burkholderiaceae bacterium]
MAMNIAPSESAHGDPDVMVEMNTTPLIDVMLVLLVMLIITIPIQLHSVNVDMPLGAPQTPIELPKFVTIKVDEKSRILWDDTLVPDRATLEARMQVEARKADQPEIHFMPNRAARYEVVAGVMASAQRLGLQKIGMGNIEEFGPPARTQAPSP